MTQYIPGIIPFGSDDETIIKSCSLKSAAIVSAASGVEIGSPTYDSELGVLVGTDGGIRFDLSALGYSALDNGGQFSIEVESVWISSQSSSDGAGGYDHTTNEYLISHGDGNPPTNAGRHRMNLSEQFIAQMKTTDAQTANTHTSLGKSRFCTVTISWIGNTMSIYVDGIISQISTFTQYADMFKFVWLGDYAGGSNGSILNHYIRNFHISTRPVMIPKHRKLTPLAFFGDSFVSVGERYQGGVLAAATPYHDHTFENIVVAYLRNRGIGCEALNHGNSGSSVNDSSGDALETGRATMLADRPYSVLFQAGTNDANDASVHANFDTDLKDHMTTILASIPGKIYVGTVPTLKANSTYDSQTYVDNKNEVNTFIKALPAWWDTNNPSDTGRIVVVDIDAAFGAEYPQDNIFNGQVSGALDDLHPSAKGNIIRAELFAQKILSDLEQ